ncbi:MAG TPA: DegT/DnrJ/EryC1/StrS family aminotransferase [Vicinamibacterales bacterium]|nr:DegT/DnrJ/EryC1/StrS family aminotransferase [Vicinamibacterales bacterium]
MPAAPMPFVPLLDLQAQYRPLREALLEAVTRVCDSQRCILGDEVVALERELAAYLGVGHALGVSSGTDALVAALMALEIGPGDEVITPTFSFFASAGSVVRVGARPVFVDIDPRSYNLDLEAVAQAITPRTRAIMPVHLYGQAADMTALVALAGRHGLAVIEDAAQAIGARDGATAVGGLGTIGCFSFYPTKNLGAFGDGGLVTTNDAALADRLRLLRDHGQHPKYHHALVGGNFRLDAIQGAVLRVKLPHLAAWTEGRRRNAARYRALFAEAGLDGLVTLPYARPDAYHIYNQFVVQVADRDRVREHLTAHGIGTEIYYPVPFHRQACFASLGHPLDAFPCADAAAARVLALPIYAELADDQLQQVVAAVADALR